MKNFGYVAFTTLITVVAIGCKNDELASSTPTNSPQDALQTFFDGILEGDQAKSSSVTVSTEQVKHYIESTIRVVKTMDKFAALDAKYFGAEGAMPVGAMAQSINKNLQNVPIKVITNDRAQWPQNPNSPMVLTKINEVWKIDFTGPQFETFLEIVPETFSRTAQMYDELCQSITDGKIQTREGVRKEMARLKTEYGL